MKTTTTIALLAVLSMALALAAAFGAWTASRGVHEEVSSGELCASCHTTGHALGGHSELDCTSCHTIDEGLADQLAWSASGVTSPPDHEEVTDCVSCHDERPESAVVSEGHRGHADLEGGCTSCHSVMHTDVPPTTCESCHAGVEQHGATADVACTSCHVFAAAPAPERPDGSLPGDAGIAAHLASFAGFSAGSSSAAHDQPIEGSSRIHGAMDCRRCHDPHQAEEAVVDCESCHRGYLAEQVHAGPAAHGECSGCHEPHGDRENPADCLHCHSYPERGHGWSATPGAVTDAMRAETAARITHEGNCASCHDPHSSVASEERCVGCHEEQGAALAALPAGSHEACATCHEPHEPQPTAAVCTTCHTEVHARDSNIPQHRDCLSCHEPHHGRPSPREACASCHTSAHAQSQTSAAQHRDCGSCHEEHGRPLAPTAGACASCHANESRAFAVAGVPAEHRCGSCHEPHRFPGGNSAVTRCASCHSSTVSLHASHRGDCRSCHEEHGAPLGTASGCTSSSCHRAVRTTVAAHDDCNGCHTPHRAAVAALDACASCHADEVRNASRWPRGSAHAGECSACHEHHDETSVPRDRGVTTRAALCQSCHTEQANRSHTGGHDTCVGCHAPHRPPAAASGLGGPSGGWWAACSNCHAEQSSAVARAQGTHGQCAACHETPGTPVPTCVGCHTERDRRLAHTIHAEASCSSCHATHGSAPTSRTACLSCHEAQQTNHFPDAATCQSCHLFR